MNNEIKATIKRLEEPHAMNNQNITANVCVDTDEDGDSTGLQAHAYLDSWLREIDYYKNSKL
jgi:hypothetical protein